MKRKLLPLLHIIIFILFTLNAVADTFIVTSNADSGPGTLRDAITQANLNGTTISDNIFFNIADNSRSGRTIILNSRLPLLSSNLIIDGSTQGGTKFGVTDAKIELLVNVPQTLDFNFFEFNECNNIEIYGLFFFNEPFTKFSSYGLLNGIVFTKSTNITIGKPGKGNYFRGLESGISSNITTFDDYYLPNSGDITIQSNIFGNDEAGEPTIAYNGAYVNPTEYSIRLINSRNIKIGGTTAAEGNTITTYQLYIQSNFSSDNGYLSILNNNMGLKTDGTPSAINGTYRILVTIQGAYSNHPIDYDVTLSNNRISGRMLIAYCSKYLKIQGNKIFNYAVNSSSDYNTKLTIGGCTGGGIIGGELPQEQNEIYNNAPMMFNNVWSNIPTGAVQIGYSPKILISKNKTYCATYYGAGITVYGSEEPFVSIDHTAAGFVNGRATPNCTIEVFLDDDCWACDGVAYLGKTTSNADSSWSFSGTFTGVVIATARKADSTTSGYTEPTYRLDSLKIKYPTCGLSNGSITNIKLLSSWDNVEWHTLFYRDNNSIDSVISRNVDLVNAPPGNYYFVAKLGESCHSALYGVNLRDYTPKIDESNLFITNPSCGNANGSISNVKVTDGDFSSWKWVNSMGVIFPANNYYNSSSVNNLPQGNYRLIVTDTTIGCADTSAWQVLVNKNGPSLKMDNVVIKAATCANADGSIKGITSSNITGTPFIRWLDSLNNAVGYQLDLVNVPAGKYRLQLTDDLGCDTLSTVFYTVPGIGSIVIDTTNKNIHTAGCTVNNGSIGNIKVTGAQFYQWQNITTGTPAGSTLTINNLTAGHYQLTASNSSGCSAVSPVIVVPSSIFIPITVEDAQVSNVTCDKINGSIKIVSFSADATLYTFKWLDSSDNHLAGIGTSISNVAAGTYLLIAKDTNGCEKQIYSQRLAIFGKPVIDPASLVVTNDECSLKQGAISGIKITGLTGPTTYTWTDEANNIVGKEKDLKNAGAGKYQLSINDAGNCTVQSQWITLVNSNNNLDMPVYKDQIIIRNTAAVLTVSNFQPGTYILYGDANGTNQLQKNTTGIFSVGNLSADAVFYIKRVASSCSSQLAAAKVTVTDKSSIYVPNAFSPNNDGKNDLFKPIIFGLVKLDYFVIYNRYGEIVFKTTDTKAGWDGKYKGKEMGIGSYIWMIKATDELTGNVLDQKGTVMIIR